ncbi:ATP-dependent helicase BRM-like protein [Tanacetum coccineum]
MLVSIFAGWSSSLFKGCRVNGLEHHASSETTLTTSNPSALHEIVVEVPNLEILWKWWDYWVSGLISQHNPHQADKSNTDKTINRSIAIDVEYTCTKHTHLAVIIGKSVVLVDIENPQGRKHALKMDQIQEKQLKYIFQWRKKLLESHWAIWGARTQRNRGVVKYHEKMLREFSKKEKMTIGVHEWRP